MMLLLLACAHECTLMGYTNSLTLHLSYGDDSPVVDATGTVSVAGESFDFDCAVGPVGAERFSCDGNDVFFMFDGPGGEVQYEVHTQGYVGADTVTPDWQTSEPNGEGCGTKYDGEIDVMLFVTP